MKKFFGWLFILAGVGNIIMVFAMAASGATQAGSQNIGGKLFFGIGFLGLGIWMISSSKPDNDNSNLPDKTKGTDLTK